MNPLIESLRTRYQAVLESGSDSFFYQNLHHYFDLVEKTPESSHLLEESQREYAQKHGKLWEHRRYSEEEADKRAELTFRLERFNLYACSATIYVRIYLPIEDYKNSEEPEIKQDPAAVLMIRGMDKISPQYEKESPIKWGRKKLRVLNKWYDGKRPYYEKELRQFHLLLVGALEHTSLPPAPKFESVLDFDQNTGDFIYLKKKGTLNPATQPYKILRTLVDSQNTSATYLTLWRSLYPEAQDVSKSQKQLLSLVIRNLKRELGILPEGTGCNPDIIKNVPKHGYRLILKGQKTSPEQD
jgi:hypothetical protein